MFLLAYGEFQSTTYWGAFDETLPFFLRWIFPPFFLYLVCSLMVDHIRSRGVGILAYLLIFALMAPNMAVLGAYGPAHVAMEVGFWAWPAFLVLIYIKTTKLWISDSRKKRISKQKKLDNIAHSDIIDVR